MAGVLSKFMSDLVGSIEGAVAMPEVAALTTSVDSLITSIDSLTDSLSSGPLTESINRLVDSVIPSGDGAKNMVEEVAKSIEEAKAAPGVPELDVEKLRGEILSMDKGGTGGKAGKGAEQLAEVGKSLGSSKFMKAIKSFSGLVKSIGKSAKSFATDFLMRALAPFQSIMDTVMGLADVLSIAFIPIVNDINALILELYPYMYELAMGIQDLYGNAKDFISNLKWEDVTNFFKNLPNAFVQWIQNVGDQLSTWFKDFGPRFIEWVADVGKNLFQWLATVLPNLILWLVDMRGEIFAFLVGIPTKVVNFLADVIPLLAAWIKDMIPRVIGFLADFLPQLWGWVQNSLWPGILDALSQGFTAVWDFFKSIAGLIWEAIKAGFSFWD